MPILSLKRREDRECVYACRPWYSCRPIISLGVSEDSYCGGGGEEPEKQRRNNAVVDNESNASKNRLAVNILVANEWRGQAKEIKANFTKPRSEAKWLSNAEKRLFINI